MTYSDNLYLKRMAEKLTNPIKGYHTDSYYLKIISENISKGGGGGTPYDDTAIKRRITAVENGKQDNLIAGSGILITANTISAKNIIDDTKNSLTTVWSSNKVKSIFESIQGGVDIVITATRPDKSLAVEKTMYYVGTEAPYHIWFFLDDEWEDFGTTEISLENYYTKEEIGELLDDKVDKETGKVLIPTDDLTQITTNKTDIANLQEEKQDKITDSTVDSISDSTKVSEVNASAKTSKSFTLSALWNYIKSKILDTTSDTYDSVTGDDLFSQNGAYDLWDNATKASNNNIESASANFVVNLETGFSVENKVAYRFADNLYYIHMEIKPANQMTSEEYVLINSKENFKINDMYIQETTFGACSRGDTSPMGCTWNGGKLFAYPVNTVVFGAGKTIKIGGVVRTYS